MKANLKNILLIMFLSVFGVLVTGYITFQLNINFNKLFGADFDGKIIDHGTTEIEGFNSVFSHYQGKQTGAEVKALLNRLIANANTYIEEPTKIPCISIRLNEELANSSLVSNYAWGVKYENCINGYVEYIRKIMDSIELKHTYNVILSFNSKTSDKHVPEGFLSGITINYDENDNTSSFIEGDGELPNRQQANFNVRDNRIYYDER